jgi:hypothetical protein
VAVSFIGGGNPEYLEKTTELDCVFDYWSGITRLGVDCVLDYWSGITRLGVDCVLDYWSGITRLGVDCVLPGEPFSSYIM